MLTYWNRQPPTHLILAAVYLKKPNKGPKAAHIATQDAVSPAELIAAGVMVDNTKKSS